MKRFYSYMFWVILVYINHAFAGSPVLWGSPYPLVLGKGGVRFQKSDTTTTCNAAAAGSIRYNAGTFEACNGSAWSSMAGTSGATYTANQYGVVVSSANNATLTVVAPDASLTKILTSGGAAANPTWSAPASASQVIQTKATTYNPVLVTDDVILASGSAFTITLYAASGNSGKVLKVKKTDAVLANVITIDGNASETIDGALTTTLNTQYEEVELLCDGSNWHILNLRIDESWQASHTVSATNLGTISSSTQVARRQGSNVEVVGTVTLGTTTGTAATISLGYLADADVTVSTGVILTVSPSGHASISANGAFDMKCLAPASDLAVFNIGVGSISFSSSAAALGTSIGASTNILKYHCKFPVVGWKG